MRPPRPLSWSAYPTRSAWTRSFMEQQWLRAAWSCLLLLTLMASDSSMRPPRPLSWSAYPTRSAWTAMIPYAFAAMTMQSVGKAANDMVKECLVQFPGIISPEKIAPDYEKCIRISTAASLREMLAPGALVIFSPLVAGLGFGKNCCAGLLSGALVSSVQLAISMSNSGGAWDNAKKYISSGGLGSRSVALGA